MRNLKKVLALVLAVAMLASFGMVASAASYSDVASNANYADAVGLLSNLGIIAGYEDGTFRPDNTVTRAEAATMMVRMLGLADEVEAGETSFTDVAADHWASGYVNVAEANSIVAGMGDGTFNPEGEVTYGQIVKMIVCALGYEPVADANGGWLGGGYIYAGSKAGFTKGVSGTANAAASRATVARLIYNALEVNKMDQKTYSNGINGGTWEETDETILSDNLGLEKIDAIITNTYLAKDEVPESAEDMTVTVRVTKLYADESELDVVVGDTTSYIAANTDAATLLGYQVTAYVGENEDGDMEMFAVAAKANKNDVLVLDTDDIVGAADGNASFTATEITYYKSAKKTTTANINSTYFKAEDTDGDNKIDKGEGNDYPYENVIINGILYSNMTEVIDAVNAGLEEITLLDNNADGDFDFVIATIPTSDAVEFVVEEVDYEDCLATGSAWDGTAEEFYADYDDETKLYTIVKDGKIVEFDAIVEGDVVTILDDTVANIVAYVSSVKVESAIGEKDEDVYTIAGKEYKLSPMSFDLANGEELSINTDGVFYMNAMGKIAYVDEVNATAGADYVYLVAAGKDTSDAFDDSYIVKLVNAKGEVETLKIRDEKVKVLFGDTRDLTKVDADVAYTAISGEIDNDGVIAKIDTTTAGEISAVYFAGADGFESTITKYDSDATDKNYEYNKARAKYGVHAIADSVLVFNVDMDDLNAGKSLTKCVTVSTVANTFADGGNYSFTGYAAKTTDDIEVIVVTGGDTSIEATAPVMVVTGVKTVSIEDGDNDTLKITGVVAGETVSVLVDPDDTATVEKGNVIVYTEVGEYVEDVEVLFDSTADGDDLASATLTGTADISAASFTIGEKDLDGVHIAKYDIKDGDEAASKYFTVEGDPENNVLYFADGCTITVVDYTGKTVSITTGKTSDLRYSVKNTKGVFVKTAEDSSDEVTDVVVFVK